MKNVYEDIKLADSIINRRYNFDNYNLIYPFTTENIKGYFDLLDIKDKSVLTVGSSIDQALNSYLYESKDIDIFDINPFINYYYYLKKSAIKNLNYDEFLEYLVYYIGFFKRNNKAFNIETSKNLMSDLDYKSYLFWNTLFSNYKNLYIRRTLFSSDEYNINVLKNINPYLNKDNYYKLKSNIDKFNPKIINSNLLDITDKLNKNYDIIFLSNIAHNIEKLYDNDLNKFRDNINSLLPFIKDKGFIVLAYLYDFDKNTKINPSWDIIHNVKLINELFDGNIELLSFEGISKKNKDSILIYKK